MIVPHRSLVAVLMTVALCALFHVPSASDGRLDSKLQETSTFLLEKNGDKPHLIQASFCIDDKEILSWERARDDERKQILAGAQVRVLGNLADLGEVPNPWGGSSPVHLWASEHQLGPHVYRVELAAEGLTSRVGPESALSLTPAKTAEDPAGRIQFALLIDGKRFSWWRIPSRGCALVGGDTEYVQEKIVRSTSGEWERSLLSYALYTRDKCLFSLQRDSAGSFLLDSSKRVSFPDAAASAVAQADICLRLGYRKLEMVLSAGPPDTRKISTVSRTKLRIDFKIPTSAYLSISVFASDPYARIRDFALFTSVGYGPVPVVP